MADLKTNYVDDVLDTSVNVKRKYRMIQNADGTVSFDDVTTYTQNGDSFGAKDINDTNAAVNELNSNFITLNNKALSNDYEVIGTHVGTSGGWTYTSKVIQGGWDKYQRIVVICKNESNNIVGSTEVMINDITEVPSIYVMAICADNTTKYADCNFFNNGIVYIGAVGTNITCEVRGFIRQSINQHST